MSGILFCRNCNANYSSENPRWICDCGGLLDIHFDYQLDPFNIHNRKPNLWRYREAIPVTNDSSIVSFEEGFTPLIKFKLKKKEIFLKADHLFQSGSFKDRGSTVLISKVNELNIKKVIEDSSGNAGASIAAYCARACIKCKIFVPSETSFSKLVQIKSYGAELIKVDGGREKTAEKAFSEAKNEYYASHVYNPFFFQGTKTIAFEICEQLGWKTPDTIIVPCGNGTLVIGAFIGFSELMELGITDSLPKIIAVQTEAVPAIEYFMSKLDLKEKKPTLAEGIAIQKPARIGQIAQCLKKSGGNHLNVSEAEIIIAQQECALNGFFIENTAAVALAGTKKYLEFSKNDEVIVTVITGHGLKSNH